MGTRLCQAAQPAFEPINGLSLSLLDLSQLKSLVVRVRLWMKVFIYRPDCHFKVCIVSPVWQVLEQFRKLRTSTV